MSVRGWWCVDPGHYVSMTKPSYTAKRLGLRGLWELHVGSVDCRTSTLLAEGVKTYAACKALAQRHKADSEASNAKRSGSGAGEATHR